MNYWNSLSQTGATEIQSVLCWKPPHTERSELIMQCIKMVMVSVYWQLAFPCLSHKIDLQIMRDLLVLIVSECFLSIPHRNIILFLGIVDFEIIIIVRNIVIFIDKP